MALGQIFRKMIQTNPSIDESRRHGVRNAELGLNDGARRLSDFNGGAHGFKSLVVEAHANGFDVPNWPCQVTL